MELADIKKAVERLSPKDLAELAAFIRDRHPPNTPNSDEWDKQIEEDSGSGKLDFLFNEAVQERTRGELRDWP